MDPEFLLEVETLGCLNEDSLVHVCIPAGNARS